MTAKDPLNLIMQAALGLAPEEEKHPVDEACEAACPTITVKQRAIGAFCENFYCMSQPT